MPLKSTEGVDRIAQFGKGLVVGVIGLLVVLSVFGVLENSRSTERSTSIPQRSSSGDKPPSTMANGNPMPAETLKVTQDQDSTSGLDTIPLRRLIPRRTVAGMLFDSDDDLPKFHLEERGGPHIGAHEGVVGRWTTTGEFDDSAMLRLFRYRTPSAARRYQHRGYVAESATIRDTILFDHSVKLITNVWHNERYSTISTAIIEFLAGRTEVEVIQQEASAGYVHNTLKDEQNALRRVIALFGEVVKQAEQPAAVDPAPTVSAAAAAAREARFRRSVDSLQVLLEVRREGSFPVLPLKAYTPSSIGGFSLDSEYPPEPLSLRAMPGATSGWMSEWTAVDGYDDDYHDLLIDVYQFEQGMDSSHGIVGDMLKVGSPEVTEIEGLPALIVVRQLRPGGADVELGYTQDGLGIRILVSRGSSTSVDANRLRREARNALSAILHATGD